jgi:phosphoribosylglycinamide formyltransferase-1
MNILFLVSGNGGNLKFFFNALDRLGLSDVSFFVVGDRDCGAIQFAIDNKIPQKVIEYSREHNQPLLDCLRSFDPDVVITNWHKIIDAETVEKYKGKLINLHYSLLPAFGGYIGTRPIEMAYDRGCRFVGTTCHFVDEEVDHGKIISQAIIQTSIPLDQAINEIFRKGCLILLNSVLLVLGMKTAQFDEHPDNSISPPLAFDAAIFDERFWADIASL